MERFARIMVMLFLIGCSTEADFRGGIYVRDNIEERACELANFIIENSSTVRATAQKFGISKSTVHKDLTERLSYVNKPLYLEVNKLITEGTATVKVLDTTAKWFGVTYAADRQGVVDKIQALVDAGEYPNKLF